MDSPLATQRGVGDVVGGCQIIRRLDTPGATDGARSIFLARQLRLGNRLVVVTLTSLRPVGAAPAVQLALASASVDEAAARWFTYVRALARLAHPNIIALYDAGLAGDDFYLVTQYAPDGSLADALRGTPASRWTLDLPAHPRFTLELTSQLAAALQHLHDHGVAHGAVCPACVLLHRQPDGYWHALLAEPQPPPDPRWAGAMGVLSAGSSSPGYGAPTGGGWDAASPANDQYALAALALLLLTGRAPEQQSSAPTGGAAARYGTQPGALIATVPAAVEQVIARALAPDPAARFPSVAAFAEALWLASGFETRPVTVPHPPTQPIAPVPRQHWLEPERTLPEPPRAIRRVVRAPPRARIRTGRRRWRRGALVLTVIALLIGALVLVMRLPDTGWGLIAANGQRGGASRQEVGIAGGQIAIARGASATATASMAAAAPPPTPPGPSDWATLIAPPGTIAVAPGQRVNVSFVLRNSGASTWSAAGGYGLTCDLTHHPASRCSSGLWIGFGQDVVTSGEEATFTVNLAAPTDPGSYALWLNLAHAGHIFTSPDVPLLVVVQVPPQPTATPSAPPTSTPSPSPTSSPTDTPTNTPTDTPTASPTSAPQDTPTVAPMPAPAQTLLAPAAPFLALGTSSWLPGGAICSVRYLSATVDVGAGCAT